MEWCGGKAYFTVEISLMKEVPKVFLGKEIILK